MTANDPKPVALSRAIAVCLSTLLLMPVGCGGRVEPVPRSKIAPEPERRVAKAGPKPMPVPPKPPRVQGDGPWLVDRARDFKLDVVTKSGTPEKKSVLHSVGTGVALFDFDGDDDLDIYAAAGTEVRGGRVVSAGGPWLFRNDGPGRWIDVTERSGLRWTGWAFGPAVCDYDDDGDLDLFVAQHGPDTLWRNRGDGTFEDVSKAAGISDPDWGVSATWGDYDGDGRLDLFVANYLMVDALDDPPQATYSGTLVRVFRGPEDIIGEVDRLWRNKGNGTFEDVTKPAGFLPLSNKGMSALFADYDGDGKQDLYVTNDTQANEFFRGLGGGKLREEAVQAGLAYGDNGAVESGMAVALADFNGDGRLDIARTNFHDQGTRLALNFNGTTYKDISQQSSLGPLTIRYVGWGLVAVDFDSDGRPDLFQTNGHVYPEGPEDPYHQPPLLLRNLGDERFDDASEAWIADASALVSGRALASGDLDGDGDLDVVATTIDGPLRVLINEGRAMGRGVVVRLVGRSPNREAIGARVELRAGGRLQAAAVVRGGSIMAASDVRLHFGLGSATRIDRLDVVWPDGSTSRIDGAKLPVDSFLTVRQGSDDPLAKPFVKVPEAAK